MSCRHAHCRECVSEYEGRLLCTVCARKGKSAGTGGRTLPAVLSVPVSLLTALLLAWVIFYATAALWPSGVGTAGFSDIKRGDTR
jgi:hypothetical protein